MGRDMVECPICHEWHYFRDRDIEPDGSCSKHLVKASESIVGNYIVFEDRAISLLRRWRAFYFKNIEEETINKTCIEGFLLEVNDKFTKKLMEEDNG